MFDNIKKEILLQHRVPVRLGEIAEVQMVIKNTSAVGKGIVLQLHNATVFE